MYTTRPTTRTTRRTEAFATSNGAQTLDTQAPTTTTSTTTMTPRTAATRAPHRVTVRKTAQQVNRLQELWLQTTTPTKEQREQIADEINLDVRIVSTWFRDERSKLTRQRAEQQRAERNAAAVASSTSNAPGPIRSSRYNPTRRFQSDAPSEFDEDDNDDQQHMDRETPLPPLFDRHHHQRASPVTTTLSTTTATTAAAAAPATTPKLAFRSPRFSPYPVSPAHQHAKAGGAAATMATISSSMRPAQRPLQHQHQHSVPIDIHRPAYHRNQLSMETDSESTYGSPSFPRQSVPAPPSVASSEDTSEDELDDEDEPRYDLLGYRLSSSHGGALDARDYSPRTPSHMPSSLPSPRVMHAPSTSIPSGGLPPISTLGLGVNSSFSPLPHTKALPQLSPFRTPITLPTDSGKTFTIEPLPIITGPQPARDSSWRWNYYDKVSSMRQTLSDKLYAHDPVKTSSAPRTLQEGPMRRADDSDEEDELLSEEGPSPISSPLFRHTRLDSTSTSMFDRLGGLFTSSPSGKKLLFASSTTNSGKTM